MPGTYPLYQQRPYLGRHVNHDPLSRRFPYRSAPSPPWRPVAVQHLRRIPIFDQGIGVDSLGNCTACTGLGLLGTGRYWDALLAVTRATTVTGAGPYPFNAAGCEALYHDITADDPFPGAWPPEDTGSDGLSMAKALVRAGIIPGYRHTFNLADALLALADYPLAVGTVWTDSMFTPDSDAIIRYEGPAVGGHEWIADEYVPAGVIDRGDYIGGTTSWGSGFGDHGRFYLSVDDFERLLDVNGDVIVLTPPTHPAPLPGPAADGPTDPDVALIAAVNAWRKAKGL